MAEQTTGLLNIPGISPEQMQRMERDKRMSEQMAAFNSVSTVKPTQAPIALANAAAGLFGGGVQRMTDAATGYESPAVTGARSDQEAQKAVTDALHQANVDPAEDPVGASKVMAKALFGVNRSDLAEKAMSWGAGHEATKAATEANALKQKESTMREEENRLLKQQNLEIQRQRLDLEQRDRRDKFQMAKETHQAKADEVAKKQMESDAGLDASISMFENTKNILDNDQVSTGPVLEYLAPVGAEGRDEAGFFRKAAGSVRQALDPEVESINQTQARISAEAKNLYDLGVMSKDDWNIMNKMSVSPGLSEAKNKEIMDAQLKILYGYRSARDSLPLRDANPVRSAGKSGRTDSGITWSVE